jgi:meso-butanediol dehydrogenase/(S,S)-butanediol dehydrogenase/diacetyl reductase
MIRSTKGVPMAGRLQDKVALITGTASGQGRAAALLFAQEGAHVIGCDLGVDGNDETVRRVKELGGDMAGMAPVNAADPDQVRAWVDEAARIHGRIDVLYNNAGSTRDAAIELISDDDWHFTMRNEIDIVFFPTRAAWPYLKKRGGVVISTASVVGHRGHAGLVAHSTSKAAVRAMARSFAAEGAPYGIRSFSISPGPIRVEGSEWYFDDPVVKEESISSTLLARLGKAEDIAHVALFLASDESAYMTGCDLPVDGGFLAKRPGTRQGVAPPLRSHEHIS